MADPDCTNPRCALCDRDPDRPPSPPQTMLEIYGPCAWCGVGAAQCGPVCLDDCSEAYEYLRASRWPVSLGLAIAAFVRRARVGELERTIGLAFAGSRADRMRGDQALDELCAMALEAGR